MNTRHNIGLIIVILSIVACGRHTRASQVASSNPLGETASYKLNKSRSSAQIKDGSATFAVGSQAATDGSKSVSMDSMLTINQIFESKNYHGTQAVTIPSSYFTDAFWDKLVADGSYNSDEFKATYLGQGSVTAAGVTYDNIYKIRLENFKQKSIDISNLKLTAAINRSFPVLGALTIDISGVALGFLAVQAGFDYQPK